MTAAELETRFPEIPWREPIPVATPAGRWFCCRICIALNGLRAVDLPALGLVTEQDCREHVEREHPRG